MHLQSGWPPTAAAGGGEAGSNGQTVMTPYFVDRLTHSNLLFG